MILISSVLDINQQIPTNAELELESGEQLPYVAPLQYSQIEDGDTTDPSAIQKSLSNSSHVNEQSDKWGGVLELCQFLSAELTEWTTDSAVEIERDTEMFVGKKLLEIGFCTGLPSAFAYRHGACSLTLHHQDKMIHDYYVKPTLRRNNVPTSRCKFVSGVLDKHAFSNQKFDIIFAPEIINCSEDEFEAIHDIFNATLSPNGIILLSSRPYYPNSNGCLSSFIEHLKAKGSFDSHLCWVSPKSGIAPRKIIQVYRTIR